jgi:putative membrane protein
MTTRLQHALKGLVLIGLALFLTNSIVNGTLLFYINRRFAWLTWVAAILLLLMAFAYRQAGQDEHQRHGHAQGDEGWWIALILVALPLLLGILVPPRPLGARAAEMRGVNVAGPGLGENESVLTRAAGERNILDWLRAFGAADDPAAFAGQEATVTGFVYREEVFAADQFMVSRFVVTCCVADAAVLGLLVSWPNSLDLPLDTWVEVHGTFRLSQGAEEAMPMLQADRVMPTMAPAQPYLYP